MKFCLNSRQPREYLIKADEIKVEYRDRKSIAYLGEHYPGKTIILSIPADLEEEVKWSEIKQYKILAHDDFIVETVPRYSYDCMVNNISFYYGYPIATWYDLNAALDNGVCAVKLDAPLFFELDEVKETGIDVRVVPNVAYYHYIRRDDGVCGTWIRPEDLEDYEPFVGSIEFEDADLRKEQALFRIYAEQKAWPGELKDIITNLNYEGTNRMIPPHTLYRRIHCGQRCQKNGACRICYRVLKLANPDLLTDYKASMEKN